MERERGITVPALYAVSTKDIHKSVLVFEENPGLCESWSGKRYIWSVSRRNDEKSGATCSHCQDKCSLTVLLQCNV